MLSWRTGVEQYDTVAICHAGHKIKITFAGSRELLGAAGMAVDMSILEKIQEQIRRSNVTLARLIIRGRSLWSTCRCLSREGVI